MKSKNGLRHYAIKLDEAFVTLLPLFISGFFEKMFQRKRTSFSTFGEDLIVESIFRRHEFSSKESIQFSYIDVGAWRPIRGSNTYKFYKKGIYGTVVEPNPHLSRVWRAVRPKDQYLPFACSTKEEVVFNQFSKLAPSNTANPSFAQEIALNQDLSITKKSKVKALNLKEIVEIHLKFFQGAFILDLDIEGDDGKVLDEFSFSGIQRPILVLVEDHMKPSLQLSPIHKRLSDNDYKLVARSTITSIYIDSTSSLITTQYLIM